MSVDIATLARRAAAALVVNLAPFTTGSPRRVVRPGPLYCEFCARELEREGGHQEWCVVKAIEEATDGEVTERERALKYAGGVAALGGEKTARRSASNEQWARSIPGEAFTDKQRRHFGDADD